MKNNNKVAVLLSCHNRSEKTLTSLRLLFDNEFENDIQLDVYLVDDGSTDGTSELVRSSFPQVNIIKGDGSLYWNRGMFTAWEKAIKSFDYDFYLWLNDDTYLYKNALELIFNTYKVNYNSIIIGTICSALNDNIITYGGQDQNGLINPFGEIKGCQKFNGNLVLIPKEVYKKLGNLDFYFTHSFGDIEYGMRAKKEGINLFITSKPVGTCERNSWPPAYLNSKNSLIKRFKLFYSPLGFNPIESFYLNYKYYSFFYAFLVFVKLHLNVFFPFLIKKN